MEKQSTHWDKEYKLNSPHFRALSSGTPSRSVAMFVDYLKEKNAPVKAKLIEAGCGFGRNSSWLAKLGFNVVGYDVSKVAIKKAKQDAKGIKHLQYQTLDVSKRWPEKDASADIVIDVAMSHLLSSDQLASYIKEVVRVLKPGGYFLCFTLDRSKDAEAKKLLKEAPGKEKGTYIMPKMNHQERVYTLAEIKKYFRPLTVEKSKLIFLPTRFENGTYERYYWWIVMRK